MPDWLFHLSFCLSFHPPLLFIHYFLFSHCLCFSFLSLPLSFTVFLVSVSLPTTPPLYFSVVLSLFHSLFFCLSFPAPLPLLFPHSFSLSVFIFLSSLPSLTNSLTQSLSHPLPLPPFPLFLSSITLALSLSPHSSLSLSLFFCLFLSLKAVIINDMVIRASRFPFSFLSLFLSPPPLSACLLYSCQSPRLSRPPSPSLFAFVFISAFFKVPAC